jgi:hypothetical protein
VRASRFSALFIAVVADCAFGVASAEPSRHVRFEYARLDGASACPDLPVIEAGVAERLGYEPFDEHTADLVRATIRTTAHGLEARIELVDSRGIVKAERRLVSYQRDCSELAASVELAVSIAIDPVGVGASKHAATAEDAVMPPTATPEPITAPVTSVASAVSSPKRRLAIHVDAGLVGTVAKAPSYSLGPRLGGALSDEIFSFGIEGQADFSARKSLQQGHARAALWTASLVPCVRRGVVAACALFTAGLLRGSGEGLLDAHSTNLFYAALGLRLSVSIPLTSTLALMVHGDATAPFTEEHLQVDGLDMWTSSHIAAALGLGLVVTFR